MHIYILRLKNSHGHNCPTHDVMLGIVIFAPNAYTARTMAGMRAGDEGKAVWLDRDCSTCKPVPTNGNPQIILRDFRAG